MTQEQSLLTFCFDHMSAPEVLGYPNLAQRDLDPDGFDHTWPRTVPCRLFVYFQRHSIPVRQCQVSDAPRGSWYPIAMAWFDFELDYIALIPGSTQEKIRSGDIRILFYYHEGDNPHHIQQRIDWLVNHHRLPRHCYLFVSANSAADIDRFYYFPDHEFFFDYVNRRQPAVTVSDHPRSFQFTALNRSHKWWRASVMSDLHRHGLLQHSLWSYNTEISVGDQETDNPLELDSEPGWRQSVRDFVDRGPYHCDSADADSHNDHRSVNQNLYNQSYFHLVLETHFDADGSRGSFITEKTYKCLKFGQPFVVIAPPGTLAVLRDHGYRVFDSVLDNRYDEISHNTERWFAVRQLISDVAAQDTHDLFKRCLEDIGHNQQHFASGNTALLQKLAGKLAAHPHLV